jgi:hypothetical protein
MVAYGGAFGLSLNLIIVVIFTYIPCNFGVETCVMTDSGAYFERADVFIGELRDSSVLLALCIV